MMHFLDYSRTEKSPIFNCYLNFLQIPNGFLVTIYAHYIGFKIQPHKKSESSKKKKKIVCFQLLMKVRTFGGKTYVDFFL